MSLDKNLKAVSYGEVLFDVFGKEKKIGGAPLNLALRTASYGLPVSMISAVGNDEDGKVIIDYIKENGLNTEGIIFTPEYSTGIVQVHINDRGSATYEIKFPSAWDFIENNEKINKIVKGADLFFYGSLICRNEVSKKTLIELLQTNQKMFKVFDVNLRAPFYTIDDLVYLMNQADLIKFNDEEILEIAESLGFSSDSLEENMIFISEKTETSSICVTKGKHGSVLLWKEEMYHTSGYPVDVVDTVGAGDSFLASLIYQLLINNKPDEALDFASAVGAMVAGCAGANPKIELSEIESFMKSSIFK